MSSSSSCSSSLCLRLCVFYNMHGIQFTEKKAAESEGKRVHVGMRDGVGGLTRVAEIRGWGLYLFIFIFAYVIG